LNRSWTIRLLLLTSEFSLLFIAIPLLIYYRVLPNLPIRFLLAGALAAFLLLRRSPGFQTSELFSLANVASGPPPLFLRDASCLLSVGLAVRVIAPELLFSSPKRAPAFSALVMLHHPVLSVFPQELLCRAFLFRRNDPLFDNGWAMILASTFVQIIFRYWLAVGLSVLGGLVFAVAFHSSKSLMLACLEHASFGNFLFTMGRGRILYHGSRF
jgi:hypothetical protein